MYSNIENNFLLLKKTPNFNKKTLNYFVNRLSIFLCTSINIDLSVLFTDKLRKIQIYYPGYTEKTARAFYDEHSKTIVFNSSRYYADTIYDIYKEELDEIDILQEYKPKYIVPISDIYHEIIHAFQSEKGNYTHTDFVEAVDELYTYFITGHWNIDYYEQSLALWNLCKYTLRLNKAQFYLFIRDSIVHKEYHNYLYANKTFIKLLGKKYNGNMSKFMNNYRTHYYNEKLADEFYKDIKYIHNLIFYKY